jgi:hypothetical protein
MRRLVPGACSQRCALPGHEGVPNIRAVFAASYTDTPPEGAPPLSGSDEVVLEPTP